MRPFSNQQTEFVACPIKIINAAYLFVQSHHAIQREDRILVTVANEQRPGCNEGSDLGIIPAISVDAKHAIAMTFNGAVDDMIFEIGDPGDGASNFDALIQGGDPPRISAAATAAGDSESGFVHLRPGLEIIQRANA